MSTRFEKGHSRNTKAVDRRDIERAMRMTTSNKQAARNVGVSYATYKKYAKMFKDDNGVTLFDKHMNASGKGVPKLTLRKTAKSGVGIMDILEGRVNPIIFSFDKIKTMILKEGLLEERCNRCGFHERRMLDMKMPIILSYKDGNKRNMKYDNLEFLCYNCFYLTIGDIFEKKQLQALEDHTVLQVKKVNKELELEASHAAEIRQTHNLANEFIPSEEARPMDFGDDLISFAKFRR